ncbi:MAG TPA: dicarboxylate/amino acid:cation symporter [Arachidicoccus sp.]|nr:dicarboxylate/amino acid:cation symporter [Arachidicoccus sp.]
MFKNAGKNQGDKDPSEKKSRGMHTKILLGLLIGVVAGVSASLIFGAKDENLNWLIGHITQPLGNLWLRLLLMIVVPLVFSALVLGVAGLGNIKKLGRVGLKTLIYTLVISAVSVVIGLSLVNLINPGGRISAETAAGLEAEYGTVANQKVGAATTSAAEMKAQDVPVITQVIEKLIPENPMESMVGTPNLLHIMFFALILGMATTLIPKETAKPFLGFFDALFEISVVIINAIMWLAPYAVTLLVFSSIASFGLELLVALLWFILVVLSGLLIHATIVYSASVYYLSALSPIKFLKMVKTTAVTAFSTSSSNATLPTALRESRENLGVPEEINSFVLTIGATANQNGTALYEGVTIIFLAQLAGVDLSISAQLGVAYLAILGGIGTAGVPGGSIPYIIVVLAGLGVNPALVAVIMGVDRLLDMCRTTVNVLGDITAATYVARSEGYHLNGELRPPLSAKQ